MKTSINIAVASHLSDAQELLAIGHYTLANREINYAKAILFKHPDTREELDKEILDEICHNVDQKLGDKQLKTFNDNTAALTGQVKENSPAAPDKATTVCYNQKRVWIDRRK